MQAEELFLNLRSLLHIIVLFHSLREITSCLWLSHDKVLDQLSFEGNSWGQFASDDVFSCGQFVFGIVMQDRGTVFGKDG